jgi:large subunit ribosomal protein L16
VQRGSLAGNAQRNNKIDFGDFGLQVLERGWITNRQIEAARVAANRHMKRRGKVWIRIFPDKPITKKPLETRMGKGKGNVDAWVAVVKPGRVIFELAGCTEQVGREALSLAANKLPVRCKMIKREGE